MKEIQQILSVINPLAHKLHYVIFATSSKHKDKVDLAVNWLQFRQIGLPKYI